MNDVTADFVAQRLEKASTETRLGYSGVSLGDLLMDYAAKDPRVCYVGVDTMELEFQRRYPDRAFNVGISEQDEMGVATGLAKAGMIPVVQAWSPFTPIRNFDQLRTSLARHCANVKIVTTALGLVNCSHGATHHDMESVALFRIIPNLTVLAPFDNVQFEEAFHAAMRHVGPVVLMGPPDNYAPGADGVEPLPLGARARFEIGRAEWLRRGGDASIISYGAALRYAWKAADVLARENVAVGVLNMCSLKPLDVSAILEAAEAGVLLTVEEQNIHGGLGGAVAEVLAEAGRGIAFKRLGIPDQFVENVGDYTETRAGIGLTTDGVVRAVRELRHKWQSPAFRRGTPPAQSRSIGVNGKALY